MKLRDWGFLLGAAGTGLLVYGALYEANRLVTERLTLRLPRWPKRLSGTRIAVLADFHLRDVYTERLAERAIAAALEEMPDHIVLVGDLVAYWKPGAEDRLRQVLAPLLMMQGGVIAVPGNHEYWGDGDADRLAPILDELNIRYLRNEAWRHEGITWVGVDSANMGRANPMKAFEAADGEPRIVLWHEPDLVDWLPEPAALQISGHTHGGQFKFGNFAPVHTRNGRRYVDGYYPHTATPLFVTRGIGTTGPPSRLNCPPQVAILTLLSDDRADA